MKFNNEKTELGYDRLTDHMKEVLHFIYYYVRAKYNIEIVITDTYRTQEEQDNIYANNKDYQIKPWQSVHQAGRGVDISVKGMSNLMIQDIVNTANRIKYSDKHKTSLYHDVGSGIHIHFQVPYERCKQDEQ